MFQRKRYIAKDGTEFVERVLYNVASSNSGIVKIKPDGTETVYDDKLYCVPSIIDKVLEEYVVAYDAFLDEKEVEET